MCQRRSIHGLLRSMSWIKSSRMRNVEKSEIAMKEIKEIAEKNEKVETLEQKSVSVGKIEKEKKKKSKSTRQQEIANGEYSWIQNMKKISVDDRALGM